MDIIDLYVVRLNQMYVASVDAIVEMMGQILRQEMLQKGNTESVMSWVAAEVESAAVCFYPEIAGQPRAMKLILCASCIA
jgi:hypothetical protein